MWARRAITGWNGPDHRHVMFQVVLDLPSGPKQAITRSTYPRNLKLKAEAKSETREEENKPDEAGSAKASAPLKKTVCSSMGPLWLAA